MRRRWFGAVIEIVVSFTAAALLAWACTNIKVNPLVRIGQVSGLASIQIRFLLFAVPLLLALGALSRIREGTWFPLGTRVVCAAFAGLASGFVAGGIIVALRGTPYCLNVGSGDADILVMWANAISTGEQGLYPPPFYPPLFPHVMSYYMQAADIPAAYALKDLQIAGTVIVGPLAYLAWRLVLRPGWALAIGVIAALVVFDAYKPYGGLVLVVLMPIAIRYLARLREAAERPPNELLRTGVLYGIAFGVLCLLYSGWFRWAAPGLVLAALFVFPWRGWKRALILGVVTLVTFLALNWNYLTGTYRHAAAVSQATGGTQPMIRDDYFFFDTEVDPTYFAMWKGDLPGSTAVRDWPPPGELGGLSLYALLVFAGLGVAIALGRRRTEIIALVCVLGMTWFQRFWQAHYMFKTKLVQLWPRTTLLIAYLFIVIAGLAIYYLHERAAKRAPEDSPLRSPNAQLGALVALTLVFGTLGSSIADRYMPYDSLPRTPGWSAFAAHAAWKEHKAKQNPPAPTPDPPAPAPAPP
jgi:galactan 5-O-arabinofuranosyltransferase